MTSKRALFLTRWSHSLAVIALVSVGLVAAAYAGQDGSNDEQRVLGPGAHNEELTLFDFVGHIKQDGLSVVAYGYQPSAFPRSGLPTTSSTWEGIPCSRCGLRRA